MSPRAVRSLLAGLRARRGGALALLLTASLTVAAAMLGPLYARAAQESVLHDALTAAPTSATALLTTFDGLVSSADARAAALRSAPAARVIAAYPRRIVGLQADEPVTASGDRPPQQTRLVARDGLCAQVVLSAGRCPSAVNEVMVSDRTVASPYGYALGGQVIVPSGSADGSAGTDGSTSAAPLLVLRIVGVYSPRDPDAPYWGAHQYFDAALSAGDDKPDVVDAMPVAEATFAAAVAISGAVVVDLPLDATRVHLADLDEVAAQVRSLIATHNPAQYRDQLPATLAAVGDTRADVGIGSLLVSLQLAALALFVLFTVTGDALAARGDDVALAKLRGLTPGATLRFLLAETFGLLVLALPVGAVLGGVATWALARSLLAPGVPVVFPGAAFVAALAAFAAAGLAALVAGRAVLTRPVLDQWRGARRTVRAHRLGLIADAALALAAIAGVTLLATGGGGALALLGPGLLVLAVGLLGVRLLPVLARARVRRTGGSDRLGSFLAVRQLARRPAAMRLGVLLVVAIGLAVFAVAGESVALRNRVDRAEAETGAPRVVAVAFAPQADPVALAHRADPDGRWAMVAARWLPDGGASVTGSVLGVDPDRLAAAGFATTTGASLSTMARAVDADVPPAVDVSGTSLSVTATTTALSGAAPFVSVVVAPAGRAVVEVRAGTLTAGTVTYRAAVPCADGCWLLGLGWERPVSEFDTIAATVTVTGAAVSSGGAEQPVDLRLTDAGGWRARSPDGTDAATKNTVETTATGIVDRWSSSGGASAGLGRVDTPAVLPVWAGDRGVVTPAPTGEGAAVRTTVAEANGVAYPFAVAGTSVTIPGAGPQGVLADVTSLRLRLPSFTSEATWSVWLGPAAPADALSRLAAAGLSPGGLTLTSDRVARLGRQGPALALALLLACAVAAAVLAIGATATAIATSGRRRSFELAALRVLGVPRRALVRATTLEQGVLLGAGLVLGVPSGIGAALLAMPVIPQFSDVSPLPLRDAPQPWPVVAIGAALLVLLVATAFVAGGLLVRAAVPARLREASR